MTRRVIAAIAGALLFSLLLVAPVAAQVDEEPAAESPAVTVLPDEETPTTEAPTTTATPTTVATEVAGDVVTRPLPRTGGELGGAAFLGGALTLGGIVLAFGARRRRNSFEGT